MSTYQVRGSVTQFNGAPLGGGSVEVFHVSLSTEISLGVSQLDAQGRYRVAYDTGPLFSKGVAAPNIRIVAFDLHGNEIGRSDICFRSGVIEEVNLQVDFRSTTAEFDVQAVESESEVAFATFTQASEGLEPKDVDPAQFPFIQAATSYSVEDLFFLQAADTATAGDSDRRKAIVGLARGSSNRQPLQLLMRSGTALDFEADGVLGEGWTTVRPDFLFERHAQIEAYLSGTDLAASELAFLREMISVSLPSDEEGLFNSVDEARDFVIHYLDHPTYAAPGVPDVAGLWAGFEKHRLALVLRDLSRGNVPFVRSILHLVASEHTLAAVAALSEVDLQTVFSKASVTAAIPNEITGASVSERRARYATVIDRMLSEIEPSARFKRELDALVASQTDTPFGAWDDIQALMTNLEQASTPADRDMEHVDIYTWAQAPVGPVVSERLLAAGRIQRLLRITRYYPAALALASAGLTSAQYIVKDSAREFVRRFQGVFQSSLLAYEAYQRADRFAGAVEIVREREGGQTLVRFAAMQQAASYRSVADPARWETMFGSPDACACAQEDSVFGTPAYLFDLLSFLSRISISGGTALDELNRRRPDIQHLVLSERNAKRRIPVVDLVNEILEARVVGVDAERETKGTEEELAAYPQTLRAAAYTPLLAARSPQVLPFDLWTAEASRYLEEVNLPLPDVYALHGAVGADGDVSSAMSTEGWVRATLGLSSAQYASVSAPEGQVHLDFGFSSQGSENWATLGDPEGNQIRRLLNLARYGEGTTALSKLAAALSTRLVDRPIVAAGGAGCSTASLSTALDRSSASVLNFVLRLVESTGLSARMLDRCINAWASSPSFNRANALEALAHTLWIAGGLNLEPDVVAQFWRGDIDTHAYPQWSEPEPELSYYDRLFFPRGLDEDKAGSALDPSSLGFFGNAASLLASGLQVSGGTMERLAEAEGLSSGSQLSMGNLVSLHRDAMVMKRMRLSVEDYLSVKAAVVQPFANPSATIDFLELIRSVVSSGLNIESWAYILSDSDGSMRLSDVQVDEVRRTISEGVSDLSSFGQVMSGVVDALSTSFGLSEGMAAALFPISGKNIRQLLSNMSESGTPAARRAIRRLHKIAETAKALSLSPVEIEGLELTDVGPWGGSQLPVDGDAGGAGLLAYWRRIAAYLELRDQKGPSASEILSGVRDTVASVAGVEISTGSGHLEHPPYAAPLEANTSLVLFVTQEVSAGGSPGTLDSVDYGGLSLTRQGGQVGMGSLVECWTLDPSKVETRSGNEFTFSGTAAFASYTVISAFVRNSSGTSLQLASSPSSPAVSIGGVNGGVALVVSQLGAPGRNVEVDPPIELQSEEDGTNKIAHQLSPLSSTFVGLRNLSTDASVTVGASYSAIVTRRATIALVIGPAFPATEKANRVAERTGWSAAEFSTALSRYSGPESQERACVWASRFFVAGERAGLSASLLSSLAPSTLLDAPLSTRVRDEVRAALGARASLERGAEIRAALREEQQEALVAYVIENAASVLDLAPEESIETTTDLFNHLLLDVEMTSAVTTSRLIQGSASVQLLLQRASLGYESFSLGDQKDIWRWMSRYRVWEANRKIFLYPENYLLPELRKGKTRLFQDFETFLAENPIDSRQAKRAFSRYLDGLSDISNLQPVAVRNEYQRYGASTAATAGPRSANADAEQSTLVVAREGGISGPLYMNCWKNQLYWTGWTPIDLDVSSNHVFPVRLLGEMHLFWFTFTEMAAGPESVPAQRVPDIHNPGDEAEVRVPDSTIQAVLNYSVFRDNAWTKPQQAAHALSLERWGQSLGEYASRTRFVVRSDETKVMFHANIYGRFPERDVEVARRSILNNGGAQDAEQVSLATLDKWKRFWTIITGQSPRFYKQTLIFDASDADTASVSLSDGTSVRAAYSNYIPNYQVLETLPFSQENTTVSIGNKVSARILSSTPPDNEESALSVLQTENGFAQVLTDAADRRPSTARPFVLKFQHRPYIVSGGVAEEAQGSAGRAVAPSISPDYSLWARYSDLDIDTPFTERLGFTVADGGGVISYRASSSDWTAYNASTSSDCIRLKSSSLEPPKQTSHVGSKSNTVRVGELYFPRIDALRRLWRVGGHDEFFTVEAQVSEASSLAFDFAQTFHPSDEIEQGDALPGNAISFDLTEAYGVYAWEVFFHAPIRIARAFHADGQFEEARRWVHAVFDPTNAPATHTSVWRFKPFFDWATESSAATEVELTSGTPSSTVRKRKSQASREYALWRNNPFDPHAVAQVRPEAYMRWTVFLYLDILIDWADELFTQDTFETVGEAHQLYLLASEILGPKPAIIPSADRVFQSYHDIASGERIPFRDLYLESVVAYRDTVTFASDREDDAPPTPSAFSANGTYFCTPVNDKMVGYWEKIEDRLFKIRSSLNIYGVRRTLALTAPPIDPLLLLRALNAGVSLSEAIAGTKGADSGPYRFRTLIQEALELCSQAQSLGGLLLSAMEKRDAEELSQLSSKHRTSFLKQERRQREQALKEAQTQVVSLERSLENAQTRQIYYATREERNPREEAQLTYLGLAHGLTQTASAISLVGSAIAKSVPIEIETGANGMGGTPKVTVHMSGERMAKPLQIGADASRMAGDAFSLQASLAGINAGHQRRFEDFKLQEELATRDIEQLEAQIAGAELRVALSEHQIRLQDMQIEQNQDQEEVLRTKFTNRELYTWMASQARSIYLKAYQLAHDVAKRAEAAYRYELYRPEETFIQPNYWDSLRKGLLAGERLAHDLRRLKAAHLENNTIELEHTAHFSMMQHDSQKLFRLLASGSVDGFELTETMFDRQYLAHTHRRIRSVRVTAYGVTGPMEGVRLELEQASSQINGEDGVLSNFPLKVPGPRRMITTSGVEDGMVVDEDDRYRPFEGTGAISTWNLRLDQDANTVDRNTIRDIVFHVRYTSRKSLDTNHISTRRSELFEGTFVQPISLASDMPDIWAAMQADGAADRTVDLALSKDYFPAQMRHLPIKVTVAAAYAVFEGTQAPSVRVKMWTGAEPNPTAALPSMGANLGSLEDPRYRVITTSAPLATGSWDLSLHPTWHLRSDTSAAFSELEDVVLLLSFTK